MNQRGIIILILAFFLLPACNDDMPLPDNLAVVRPLSQQEKKLLNSSNEFSFELLRLLNAQNPGTNIFFSPIGLGNGIGMSINIIENKPKEELKKFLRISDVDDVQIDRAYYQLSEILGKLDPDISITGGNSLWINNQYAITELAGDKLMAYYQAQVDFLNFNSSNAVRTVNRWASYSTGGSMDRVISEVDPHDRAYIINTMHFDISAALQVEDVKPADYRFILPDGKQLRCNVFMADVPSVKYNRVNGISVADLPIGTGKFHMILIMPDDALHMQKLIRDITPAMLNNYLETSATAGLPVFIPALNLNKEIRLKKIFPQLGISGPISTVKSYFDNREIFISDFIHKSSLTLGEAANRKRVDPGAIASDEGRKGIVINKPFLLIIREEYTGGIIFNGIITNPASE